MIYTATDNLGKITTTDSLWRASAPLTVDWKDGDGVTVPKDMSRYPVRWNQSDTDAPWTDNLADIEYARANRKPFEKYLAQHSAERRAYDSENTKYPTKAPWA